MKWKNAGNIRIVAVNVTLMNISIDHMSCNVCFVKMKVGAWLLICAMVKAETICTN